MEGPSLARVNQHYLDRVIAASQQRDIEASEDIYSENGIKLLSKGARISSGAQERLILHKLKKPLESCIAVSEGVDADQLVVIGQQVIDAAPGLLPLFSDFGLLPRLREIPLNPATISMLTVAHSHDPRTLSHYVLVALLAIGLGRRLKLTETELGVLAAAGLLHDIGELYIDQQHLDRTQVLTPEAWRQIAVHPVIGHKLAREVCGMPDTVAQAILQHHERGDGGGYPRGLPARELSRAGRVLAAAEMIASLAEHGEHPLERAEVALRIVPIEYDPDLVSVVSQAMGECRPSEYRFAPDAQDAERTHELFGRIARALELMHQIENELPKRTPVSRQLYDRAHHRFVMIQRAFSSTGLDLCGEHKAFEYLLGDTSGWLHFEVGLVLGEIRWRLRELARDLAMRARQASPAEAEYFQPLVDVLHDG
ncbi:HD-GYP domain-containing protein [Chitinolyticbacter meiyuanensis]|uniref:HD-GYP domain-containing protein n=1 Tax=Chitinolyticbacter meiyuanensis TaxID=682798 RepID=UPI0011E5C0CE|nr:HD domain-containing phosphohydrolase [Chitinolyticbacter meiyuanensis]